MIIGMDIGGFLASLESSKLATGIRDSPYLFPLIGSFHVLALAGLNMVIFELTSGRTVDRWHKDTAAPLAGRAAAVVSLLLWIMIIFMGRWIGFSTSQSKAPLDPGVNVDDLFPAPPGENGAPRGPTK